MEINKKCAFCWNKMNKYAKCCSKTCWMYFRNIKISKIKLFKQTNFLDIKSSLKERIFCVNNNIKKIQLCQYCWIKKVWFYNFYQKTCSISCARKLKYFWMWKQELIIKTSFLNKNATEKERLYCIDNNINKNPKCNFCLINNVKFQRWEYKKFCSQNCTYNFNRLGFNVDTLTKNTKFLQKNEDIFVRIFYFLNNKTNIEICSKCNAIKKVDLKHRRFFCPNKCQWSNEEKNIVDFIKVIYKWKIIENDRNILNGKELDIYIPEKKLAIEYNWLMFHSIWKSTAKMFNNYKLEDEIKDKHLWKTEACQKQWIQLLHIFENEWLDENKRDIWKSIIKNKIWVYDNIVNIENTIIKLVSNEVKKDFLNIYHLEWDIISNINIWLFDINWELIQLMIFWKNQSNQNTKWDLLRIAIKNSSNIIWWEAKLFKYFIKYYLQRWENIKAYANLRFSNWNIYKKLWFELIWQSKLNYFYFKNWNLELETRQKYQKHKLEYKLSDFDEKLTESENMYNNWYRKTYDCWNLRFEYIKK